VADEHAIIQTLKQNPYLLFDVYGFAFKRVKTVMEALGKPLECHMLSLYANRELLINGPLPRHAFEQARLNAGLGKAFANQGVSFEGERVWHPRELLAERTIAAFIKASAAQTNNHLTESEKAILDEFKLNNEQQHAVQLALNHKFSGLTGGAGTGKTATTSALAKLILGRGQRLLICSFTGKSASVVLKTLQQRNVIPEPLLELPSRFRVTTLHSSLGARGDGLFQGTPLPYDHVIVEEASTLPNCLLAELLDVLQPHAKVTCVGDPAQLPPIGYGRPFEDALNAGIAQSHLTQNYRQAGQQSIYSLCEAIRHTQKSLYEPGGGETFWFAQPPKDRLRELESRLRKTDPLEWQAVCALNSTRRWLNEVFAQRFNPDAPICLTKQDGPATVHLRRGDKVVVLVNNHQTLKVMNGQVGTLLGLTDDKRFLAVRIGEREVRFPKSEAAGYLTLGYALTTYKFQGSSAARVVLLEPGYVRRDPKRFFYTSVSRSEEHLFCISSLSSQSWWRNALTPEPKRESTLLARLDLTEPNPQSYLSPECSSPPE